jgi:hypothetical protein
MQELKIVQPCVCVTWTGTIQRQDSKTNASCPSGYLPARACVCSLL